VFAELQKIHQQLLFAEIARMKRKFIHHKILDLPIDPPAT
jgi:hypothetical protein